MGISVANIVAFAVSEMRSARRSARTWVFAALAVGLGFGLYVYLFGAHGFGQTSAPRLNVPGYGGLALLVLLAGAFSLMFDSRQRDQRALVADALHARPFANFELHAGRTLAVAIAVWLALAVLAALVLTFESVLAYSSSGWFGDAPEPATGLATFVLLDAPPALLFWGAVTALLGSMLRFAALTLGVVASLLAVYVVALFQTPLYLVPIYSGIAHLGLAGSEILPRTPGIEDWAQRAAMLALAMAWLLLASVRQPRREASTAMPWGAALAVVGFGALGALAWAAVEERDERSTWAAAHAAESRPARIDLERLAGRVRIEPGRELAISVDLHVVAKERLDVLVFSLNPAMRVTTVLVDGADVGYSHALGLLEVVPQRPLATGGRSVVHVEASGVPDHRFAYLDSGVDAMGQSLMGSPLALLGEQASLFLPDYVALPPGVSWLPRPSANWGSQDMADFHQIDLAVSLPPGWWPAGAGRTGASVPWRFRTTASIADFALVAAPFERRTATIAGVDCELLMHPRHIRQLEQLSAVVPEATVAEFLREALTTAGLDYPHGTLSVVEAPAQLRRYGGSWWMGTVQAMPGVQLLAEHGLPTARLRDRPHRGGEVGLAVADSDMASPHVGSELIERIDDLGANGIPLSAGFARNLLPFLTAATGDGAFALNYLLEALTARVVLGAHAVAPGGWVQASVPANDAVVRGLLRIFGTATVYSEWFDYPPESVAARSEGTALKRIDPRRSQSDVDVLVHKGDQLAALIEGVLGSRKTREFLALMRRRHAGASFGKDDFIDAMDAVEPTLSPLIEHFFERAALPGFVASAVRTARIGDDENGQPRYQLLVDVRNGEPAPGVAALRWRTQVDGSSRWHDGTHAIVSGRESVEIGATSPAPPVNVYLETHLALNRRALLLSSPDFDHAAVEDWQPLDGARASDWMPRAEGIVVDDLDAGFSVVAPIRTVGRTGPGTPTPSTRIPEFGAFRDGWRRQESPNVLAWGKYRRTLVRGPPGDGSALARFDAQLPKAGRWRLAYHLPGDAVEEMHYERLYRDAIGALDIRLVLDGVETPLPFDGRDAAAGWNALGAFDLPAGRVFVAVSDKTSGEVVVADAVRWQRLAD